MRAFWVASSLLVGSFTRDIESICSANDCGALSSGAFDDRAPILF